MAVEVRQEAYDNNQFISIGTIGKGNGLLVMKSVNMSEYGRKQTYDLLFVEAVLAKRNLKII